MTGLALESIVVLDLGTHISAPYCAALLGGYGAEVIKVEPPGGDPARRAGPFPNDVPHPEQSGLFLTLNTNKKGITLDLASAAGREVLLALSKKAHLIVENHPPGRLASLGLSHETLQAANPGMVLTSITPFGSSGPYRDYQATDVVSFALSGRMATHGLPDRGPLNYAQDVVWYQAGSTAAVACVAALLGSQLGGIDQVVEVSAMECMVGNVDTRTLFHQYMGSLWPRGSTLSGYPASAYPCEDGYVALAAGGDRFFRRLCQAMGRQDMLEDPRWATPGARPANQEAFEEVLLSWLLPRTRSQVFGVLQEAGVMCAPVNGVEDLLTDPQLEARGFFTSVDNPIAGPLVQPGAPFKMNETPWSVRDPAPTLGQHNHEIYCGQLGYSRSDLVLLRSMGAI